MEKYEEGQPEWFNAVFRFIERSARAILMFWVAAYLFGLAVGPTFLKMGNDTVAAPKGTRSYPAQMEFDARFAEQARELPMLILAHSSEDVRTEAMREFNQRFKQSVLEFNATHHNMLSYASYFDFKGTLLDGAASAFVSPDKTTTFLNIMVSGAQNSQARYEFVRHVKQALKDLNPDPSTYDIGVTGMDAMQFDMAEDAAHNLMRIDSFTMPFALGLLGFMIRSWRLLLLSGFNMGLSILSSFGVMAVLVHLGAPHPESASAQLMEVMVMAVSIDWSLFLQRRFRDEIKRGAPVREAAYMSLLHSGHVVVMSGGTLVIVFVSFLFMPATTVQMDGACCATGVFVALVVSLTATPAFWLYWPEWCSDFDPKPVCLRKAEPTGASSTTEDVEHWAVPLLSRATTHVMYSGPRFRFTRWVTRWPNNIIAIIVVYVLLLPLAVSIKDMVVDQNVLDSMPRSSESAKAFRKAFEYFPGGTFSPFYVLVTSPDSAQRGVVRTRAFFDAAGEAAKKVYEASARRDTRFKPSSFASPVLLNGKEIGLHEAEALLATAKSHACNIKHVAALDWAACSAAKEYEFLWAQTVNEEENAMLVQITVPFFPFADESSAFIADVYAALDALQPKHAAAATLYFTGFEVAFNALKDKVFALFPYLFGGTFAIVFVMLGFLLKSAFVPVRLMLTLVGPLAATFGLGTLVYMKGALEFTGVDALRPIEGFFWYIPILLTCASLPGFECARARANATKAMIVGLALDYDVLLISRIMEHRHRGYDVQAAICKAVCETGGTISAAGVIMCLAFGGLLLSDQTATDACGLILTVGILLDTFVVNTVLVPAIISLGDKVAWYPTQMPMTNLKGLDCGEFPLLGES